MKRERVMTAGVVILASVGAGAIAAGAGPSSALWALVYVNIGLSMVPLIVALASRRRDAFEPAHLFALVFFILFVVRPLVDITTPGGLFWIGYSVKDTYKDALVAAAIGASFFYAGYYARLGQRIGRSLPLPRPRWSTRTLDAFAATTAALSLTLFGVFVVRSGGVSAFRDILSGRTLQRQSALAGASGYLYASPLWLLSVGVLVLAVSKSWRSGRALIAFALIGFSQILAIGGGDRSWLLPAAAAIALTGYLRHDKRPSPLAIIVIAAAVFIAGVTIPRDYRDAPARGVAGTVQSATAWTRALDAFFGGSDTAMAPNLAIELRFVPSVVPYQNGTTYLEALTRPVPRSLWHNKPEPGEPKLMNAIWPQFAAAHVGFAFSFFGEPYLNFGLIGVALVSLGFGALFRGLYVWYRREPRNRTAIALFALNWPFMLVYMRGGLSADYQRQAMAVFPLIVLLFVTRRVRRGLVDGLATAS
jgi:uncharacterized membrane protein (UPF0136 family)